MLIWIKYFGYLDIKLSKCMKKVEVNYVMKNSKRRLLFLLKV